MKRTQGDTATERREEKSKSPPQESKAKNTTKKRPIDDKKREALAKVKKIKNKKLLSFDDEQD